jgi:DNA-binding CsgD family transcriptional regulator
MAQTTSPRAEARFRQLCCLGVGGEAVMPALVRELLEIFGCFGGTFFFASEKLKLANIYNNFSTPYFEKLYFDEFHGRPDREPTGTFPFAIRTEFGVRDLDELTAFGGLDVNRFRRSLHWNELHRPQGLYWPLRLYVHAPGRGRGLGSLTLHRDRRDPPWSPEEKRRLLALEPFFAQALAEPVKADTPLTTGEATGLIVANADGIPVHFTAAGRRLLFLATFPRIAHATDFGCLNRLPAPVVQICRSLSGVLAGDALATAPTYSHRNVWGGFTFRAHPFEPESGSGLIGITITHDEPAPVRLVRRIGEMPLSNRQAEVCLMMANGADYETIAGELGISKHTAIAHGRSIFRTLDVHSKTELMNKLLQ